MQPSILIFSSLFIFSLCLNSQYYQACSSDVENISIFSPSECRSYSSQGSYCCLLSYENKKEEYYFYVYVPVSSVKNNLTNVNNLNNSNNQLRNLFEPKKLCYGLSKDGYDNIGKVIDELKEESGVESLNIDCGNNRIIYNLYNMILILFIIF